MKNVMDDPEAGIRFARMGLAAGVIVSVAGNVANVYLTETSVHLGWRIPGAVVWPSFLFLAIEVMVRNRHRTHRLGYLGRMLLMSVSVTTFITSYVNLHAFMQKTNEPFIATYAGPVGIDGMMLGCTVFLLAASMIAQVQPSTVHQIADAALVDADREFSLAAMMPDFNIVAPVSPAPVRTRAPRAQWDVALVCELAVDGVKNSEARERAGIGESTFGRYKKVANILKSDPAAEVPAGENVPAEHVEMMRRLVNR
jgi:hypothetical protein